MANIDERLEALTLNAEMQSHNIEALATKLDALATIVTNLALVVESHEKRLHKLEG